MSPFELKVPFYIENKCFLCFKRDFTIASMTHIDFLKKKNKTNNQKKPTKQKKPKKTPQCHPQEEL